MGVFDSKNFNGAVFAAYVEKTPNLNRNELIKSKAVKKRQDIADTFKDQVGGNFAVIPITGRIGGKPVNYNGATNIDSKSIKTYTQGRIVVGRADSWVENDFSYDLTGVDFLEQIAQQVGEYWDGVDQNTILSTLKGAFSMTGTENLKFVNGHTYDITGKTGDEAMFGATTLNTGMQKATGDRKSKFTLAIMHSNVSTNVENLKLLAYLKYTDRDGVERNLTLGTLNGRIVLVDDNVPTETVYSSAGVYTVTVGGTLASGDKITVAGKTATLNSTSAASAGAAAGAVVTALGTMDEYTVTRSDGVITFTEKAGYYGTGAPDAEIESTAGTVEVDTTTAAGSYTAYTTYVLGDGAIEFTDCGVKVPYEMYRDPAKNGGQTFLFSRQRKIFAPYGISWINSGIISPTDAQLETGSNWELANSNEDGGAKEYFPHKGIPIARIISKG